MEFFVILILVAFFLTLLKIDINTKKKLDNDERIIEKLDLIIESLSQSKNNEN